MTQKLIQTNLTHPEQPLDPTSTPPSFMGFVWDMFSALSNYATHRSPSFEPNRYEILSFNVESSVALAHIQKEFLPRFEYAERIIEKLTPSDPLSEPLHMLYVLSLMERGIQKWKKKHQFEVITTPKAVHVLYQRLFNKVNGLKGFLPSINPPQKGFNFPLLSNLSKTNCFFNVAIQTLFSHPELATAIVSSDHQPPEVKFAFFQYHEAALRGIKDPIDLATTLRMLYPCFQEEGQHDASEALMKMIEPVERDRVPFCTLMRKTIYADYEPYVDALKGFYPDGSRLEETQEAVYTLEVRNQGCSTLEELLFHAFNEVVTDPTPIEFTLSDDSSSVFLPRTAVHTRYVSAPKYLIFNLSLGDINLQTMTPEKQVTLVGLQRTFYLSGRLTLDNKGAEYRLLSFNVHQGEGATGGHYAHYQETPEGFFVISDDVSKKISEIEYLLAAQTAYTIVLQRVDKFISEETLYQGCIENYRRLTAMVLIFQTIDALNGVKSEPTFDQIKLLDHLTQFVISLVERKPSSEAFKELPLSFQKLLLRLWSSGGTLDQVLDYLDEQAQQPLSISKIYNEEIFSKSASLIPLIADLLAKHLYRYPKEATDPNLKSYYDLIILSIGQVSREKAINHHRCAVGRARIINTIFREIGQLALTYGVVAFRLRSWDKKPMTFETFRKDSTVIVQTLSSIARLLFTGIDPLNENKYIQLGQQLVTPAFSMAHHRYDKGVWSVSSLLTSAFQLSLSHTQLPETAKGLAINFGPLVFTDVLLPSYRATFSEKIPLVEGTKKMGSLAFSHLLYPQGKEEIAARLSALYSFASHLAVPYLERHSNPDHILTSPQAWATRALQILISNNALQSLITEIAAQRLIARNVPQALPIEERKDFRDKKYAELKQAIKEGDAEKAQLYIDEITQLEHQFKQEGIDLEGDPLQLHGILEIVQKYTEHVTTFNKLIEQRDQALEKGDHGTSEVIEKELSNLFTKIESLQERLGISSVKPSSQEEEQSAATLTQTETETDLSFDPQSLNSTFPIEPQAVSLSLSTNKKGNDKEYLVYIKNSQCQHKQIGKFSNKANAHFFLNKYNNYLFQLSKQNREAAQVKVYYLNQGMHPDDVARLSSFEPIYVEISACGSKSNVYKGDQKVFSTKNRDTAINKAIGMMDEHIASNDQTIHTFKTEMADKIFLSPSVSPYVKEKEVKRIADEQQQNLHVRDQVTQKQQTLENDLKLAEKKYTAKARLQREEIRYEKNLTGVQIHAIDQKITDNNFSLQIAQGNTTREEVDHVKKELQEKELAAKNAASRLESKLKKFQKTKKDKAYKEAKEKTEKFNQANRESDQAYNHYYELQGLDYRVEPTSEVKCSLKKGTAWDKTKAWIRTNVSFSAEVSVNVPLSQTKAPAKTSPSPTSSERRHDTLKEPVTVTDSNSTGQATSASEIRFNPLNSSQTAENSLPWIREDTQTRRS